MNLFKYGDRDDGRQGGANKRLLILGQAWNSGLCAQIDANIEHDDGLLGPALAAGARFDFELEINGAGGAALFPWALFLSLIVGGCLTLLVAMPIVWVFVRIGYAGPGSVVAVLGTAFFLATAGPVKVIPREGVIPGLLYVFAVGISYLCIAYTTGRTSRTLESPPIRSDDR